MAAGPTPASAKSPTRRYHQAPPVRAVMAKAHGKKTLARSKNLGACISTHRGAAQFYARGAQSHGRRFA